MNSTIAAASQLTFFADALKTSDSGEQHLVGQGLGLYRSKGLRLSGECLGGLGSGRYVSLWLFLAKRAEQHNLDEMPR